MSALTSIDAYGEALNEVAEKLQATQHTLPIYIGEVCKGLDIGVRRDPGTTSAKSYLRWNRGDGSRPVILLPAVGRPRWDRFLAAHEIAHFILISKFNWIPNSTNSYWLTEKICDQFARNLLIPKKMIDDICVDGQRDLREIYFETRHVARVLAMPWTQLAIQVSRVHSNLVFFKIGRSSDWGEWEVKFSSLLEARGRFSKIRKISPIYAILNKASESMKSDWRERAFSLSIDDIKGSVIGDLLKRFKVVDIDMLVFAPRPTVFIVARLVAPISDQRQQPTRP